MSNFSPPERLRARAATAPAPPELPLDAFTPEPRDEWRRSASAVIVYFGAFIAVWIAILALLIWWV